MDYSSYAATLFKAFADVNKGSIHKDVQENLKGEIFLLFFLDEHDGTAVPKDICEALGVTDARITAIIKALEQKQFLVRAHDGCDRRKIIVTLTDEGRAYIHEKIKLMTHRVKKYFEILGEEDSREFLRIMCRIAEVERCSEAVGDIDTANI